MKLFRQMLLRDQQTTYYSETYQDDEPQIRIKERGDHWVDVTVVSKSGESATVTLQRKAFREFLWGLRKALK